MCHGPRYISQLERLGGLACADIPNQDAPLHLHLKKRSWQCDCLRDHCKHIPRPNGLSVSSSTPLEQYRCSDCRRCDHDKVDDVFIENADLKARNAKGQNALHLLADQYTRWVHIYIPFHLLALHRSQCHGERDANLTGPAEEECAAVVDPGLATRLHPPVSNFF